MCELHQTTWLRSGTHSLLTNGANGRRPAQHASTYQLFHKHWWQFWLPGDSLQHNTAHCIWYNNKAACPFRKLSKHLSFSRLPFVISHFCPNFLMTSLRFLCRAPLPLRAEVVNFRDKPTNKKLLTPSSPVSLFRGPVRWAITVLWANLILKILTTVSQVNASSEMFNFFLRGMWQQWFTFSTNFSKKEKRKK